MDRPIGIFDSGLGGLTAVKQLIDIMPHESIIYFGDTGRVPYGTKSVETIKKYAMQDSHFLLSCGVKLILAACGTVSSVAYDIKDKLSVPFVGVVQATSKASVEATKNGKIGVIGTSTTIKSGSYSKQISLLDKNITVFEKACPLFVPLVECGFTDINDTIPYEVCKRYLTPLLEKDIDTLILGCTHYPLLEPFIKKIAPNVKLINSGYEAAKHASKILHENGMISQNAEPRYSFYVSDSVEDFSNHAETFLGRQIRADVRFIDITNIKTDSINN